jgi:TonB family protein
MAQDEARSREVAAHDGSEKEPGQITVPDESTRRVRTRVDGRVAGQEELNEQIDFSEVAAKLTTHANSRNPTDNTNPAGFSGDLALEIILHRIVEQARLATAANGAAIALMSGGEMVCRATSGGYAPDLGTRLNTTEGLSGACLRSRQIQCCHDALTDPRVDAEVSRQMGLRSVVVYPVLQEESLGVLEIIGVLEIFSSRASAFGDRDLQTLEALTRSIAKNFRERGESRASQEAAIEEVNTGDASERDAEIWDDGNLAEPLPAKGLDWFAAVSGAVILCVALMMATAFGMRAGWLKRGASNHSQTGNSSPSPSASSDAFTPKDSSSVDTGSSFSAATPKLTPDHSIMKQAANGKNGLPIQDAQVPAGSLLVYENGREIFRVNSSPGENRTPNGSPDSSSDAVGSVLERQVEPQYPEKARAERVEGSVLLHIRTDRDGKVQQLKVLKGNSLLAQAATAAVAQWKFRPRFVDGHPAEIETEITLKFALPPN